MADDHTPVTTTPEPAEAARPSESAQAEAPAKKAAAKKAPAKKAAAKKAPAAKKTSAKKATAKKSAAEPVTDVPVPDGQDAASAEGAPAKKAAGRKAPAKTTAAKTAAAKTPAAKKTTAKKAPAKKAAAPEETSADATSETVSETPPATAVLFQAPDATGPRRRTRKAAATKVAQEAPAEPGEISEEDAEELAVALEPDESIPTSEGEATTTPGTAGEDEESGEESGEDEESDEDEDGAPARRRRRRGGRRRRKPAAAAGDSGDSGESEDESGEAESETDADEESDDAEPASATSRRRRRRRRAGEGGAEGDDEPNTVVRVRESRPLEQQITAVSGSTRLEAKKQRRREGREAGRRRAPIVSEAEFLARRESVERVMVIRQRDDLTQIGVLEDKVLVEHYVARESQTSLIGNIYLGRVQNVLPSMEAAFIDIGKGRNAVLYAGEVNWSALGHKEGQPRKIESVLSSGQSVLVQVTKDPVGHKGARLTSQISLAGRFLVYVPDGTTSGISRKLPDTERNRLKTLLKEIVPESAGVIVRTAAEGASEEELTSDVERLKARWADIDAKSKGSAPQLLYGEPDLTLKVVRDLFTEDFSRLVVQGDAAWDTVRNYVDHVAPDLAERLEKHEGGTDLFSVYRVDEQIAKGLDRKVWLPSGGSLIIDRTEAMTVVDVNTGKFTGSGGNLEETVTKNNLEAAEEMVRQLRLRDIGGIIVVDFIDMVLESNRDLVLRRLVECLGRDRTRHQVAEVTSLGLVQMTRKRIGTGLLEAFSETCSHCQGRGIIVHDHPIENGSSGVPPMEEGTRRNRRSRSRKPAEASSEAPAAAVPSPKDIAMLPRHEPGEEIVPADEELELELEEELLGEELLEAAEPAEDLEPFAETPEPVEPVEAPAPAEPAAPKVVTRTRRGASRQVVSTGEATVMDGEIAAVDAPVVVPETAEPPKVITRTRGGASRAVVSTGE